MKFVSAITDEFSNKRNGGQFFSLEKTTPGGMFANSIRARAHSHGHAHDCRHAHARGYYHGHKKCIIGIAHGYSHGHAHFTLAVPLALSTGTPDPTLLKASF